MKTFNFAGLLMAALTAIMILASCSDSKTSTGVSLERHHRAEGLEGLNNTVRLLTATAPAPQCGNLILEDGEQCDTSESSTCLSCNLVLAKGAPVATDYCGNAVTEPPEQCDDGNDGNEDSCTQYCQRAVCGDGYVQPSNGEVCDDKANGNNNDLCTDSCQIPTSERAATIDCAGSLCFVPVSPSQNTVNSAASAGSSPSAGSTGSDYQVEQKGDDTGDDSITGWVRKISSHGDAEECMFADSARDPAKYSQCSVEDDFPRCSNTTKHYDCDAKTFRVVDWTGGEGWPISLEDATCWGPGPCEDGTCTTGEHKGSICDDNGGQVDTPYCETAGNICNVCETARVSLTPGSRPYADCLNDQDHYWEEVESGGWAETGGCRGCWVSFDEAAVKEPVTCSDDGMLPTNAKSASNFFLVGVNQFPSPVGEEIFYQCDAGYTTEHQPEPYNSVCRENGKWGNTPPRCVVDIWSDPVEPDSALGSDYQVEQNVVVDMCVFTKVQRNKDKCTACGWTWRSWYKEGSKGCVEE